ncbi:hypothetical protein GJ744_011144 [Endocarpon pusillum]|uniref:Uncharacterized protein n=1 Tax=Endocarpon pusillum TaxID=364733 RepID=A0A8H7ADI8_9EURO|nr:hypothetical protein GJ744_011144 [Endocarpon pusillum]
MEAVAAISLAANICQFVDFSCRVLREGKQISIRGSSLSVQHLSLVADDLKKFLLSLKQQLESCNDPNAGLDSEDQALVDLANGCNEVAQALLDGLQKYPRVAEEERREAEMKQETRRVGRPIKASKVGGVLGCEVFERPLV